MDILTTQQLLERLASLLRSENRNLLLEYGLQPVQFEALYYLSICNRYSDTPMGVTEYLGQTKGSVSQSLKVLEKKGFIEKVPDEKDKRVAHMKLTKAGRKLVCDIQPSPLMEAVVDTMSAKEVSSINSSLKNLLMSLQHANGSKSFGQCATCLHNIKIDNKNYQCGLTGEPLSENDVQLICREHN